MANEDSSLIRMGLVKWFDAKKGFGFIQNPEGIDVFFHWTALPGHDGSKRVYEGDMATYHEEERESGLYTNHIVSITRLQE